MREPVPRSVSLGLACQWSGAGQVQSVTAIPTGVLAALEPREAQVLWLPFISQQRGHENIFSYNLGQNVFI